MRFVCTLLTPALLITAPAAAGELECDLNRRDLPGVILIGEDHGAPTSIDLRFRIASAAARGAYPAAIEPMGRVAGQRVTITGSFLPGNERAVVKRLGGDAKRSLLRGIEEPGPYAIFFSYFFRIDQMNRRQPPFVTAMNLVDFAHELPPFARALERLTRRGSKTARALAAQLRHLSTDDRYQRLDDAAKVGLFHERFSPRFGLADFDDFARAHHAAMVELSNQDPGLRPGGLPLPILETERDRAAFGCVGSPCEATGRLRQLFIDQRDQAFGRAVGRMLCAHAGRWSHVVVDVGYDHVPGVRSRLTQLTKGRARVETFRSDHPEELAGLTAALARIQRVAE